MKRLKYILFAVLPLSLVGCNQDETPLQPDGTAVEFTTNVETRTSDGGNLWVAGDAVGIYMKTAGQALAAGTIVAGADNRQYTASTAAASSALTAGAVDQTIYYPHNGTVDFIAYHPFKATGVGGIENYIYPIDLTDQSTQAKQNALDLLYSRNATGIARSTTAVPMTFNHALSKLRVNVIVGTDMVATDFTGMTTTAINMPFTGTLDLATGIVHAALPAPLTLPVVTTASGAVATFEAVVIPHNDGINSCSSRKLLLSLANGDIYQCVLPITDAQHPGQVVTYNITINKALRLITVSAPKITLWTGTTATPISGGTTERFRIGDYYPDPHVTFSAPGVVSSGVAPIGIVYSIWKGGKSGRIVSLDEGFLAWGPNTSFHGTMDEDNGPMNQTVIEGMADFTTKYPAFNWVYVKNGSVLSGPWYLPAMRELQNLSSVWLANRLAFNDKLTASGGTALSTDSYWSSSPASGSEAWRISFDSPNKLSVFKNYLEIKVRAVLTF